MMKLPQLVNIVDKDKFIMFWKKSVNLHQPIVILECILTLLLANANRVKMDLYMTNRYLPVGQYVVQIKCLIMDEKSVCKFLLLAILINIMIMYQKNALISQFAHRYKDMIKLKENALILVSLLLKIQATLFILTLQLINNFMMQENLQILI